MDMKNEREGEIIRLAHQLADLSLKPLAETAAAIGELADRIKMAVNEAI